MNEVILSNLAIIPKQMSATIPMGRAVSMERDMNTAIVRYLERSSATKAASLDGLVSVMIFSGLGLLISLSVLMLDQYIPGDWF